jgi:hypothetical protein
VHRRAQDIGADQPVPQQRLVVDLLLQQVLEQPAPLGVADEHEAAAVALVRDVVLEGVEHVAVGDGPGIGARSGAGPPPPIMLSVSWR